MTQCIYSAVNLGLHLRAGRGLRGRDNVEESLETVLRPQDCVQTAAALAPPGATRRISGVKSRISTTA